MHVTKTIDPINGFIPNGFVTTYRREKELLVCEIAAFACLASSFDLALASGDIQAAGAFITSAFLFLAVWVAVRVTRQRFLRRNAAAIDLVDKFISIAIQSVLDANRVLYGKTNEHK